MFILYFMYVFTYNIGVHVYIGIWNNIRGREGAEERENVKQSQSPAWSLTQNLPWDHDLSWYQESDAYPTEPPKCPWNFYFQTNKIWRWDQYCILVYFLSWLVFISNTRQVCVNFTCTKLWNVLYISNVIFQCIT